MEAARVISRIEMKIASEDDIVLVRRKVRSLAEQRGFDPFATTAITTATSELARNTWSHGGGGEVIIEELERSGTAGVRAQFRDRGPGIADIPRVLAGGYSTMRSMGLGVSGSRRLVDEFEIDSVVGRGTVVTISKWKRL
jgi:serine/threonine-protein kinase RsbT